MNIQFCHNRKLTNTLLCTRVDHIEKAISFVGMVNSRGGETIALESIEPWLLDKLVVGDFFTKSIGKARCSNSENYNKKTGRELAKSRMKPKVLTVTRVYDFGEEKFLVLTDSDENMYFLKKKEGAKKLHFIAYE